jgi:hypothetical protein
MVIETNQRSRKWQRERDENIQQNSKPKWQWQQLLEIKHLQNWHNYLRFILIKSQDGKDNSVREPQRYLVVLLRLNHLLT